MGTWLQRRLESLLDNILFAALLAGGLVVWALIQHLPGPIIAVIFLLAVAAILWILGQIRSTISRVNAPAPTQVATASPVTKIIEPKYIPDSYIQGRIINLLDLIPPGGPPMISNRTIEDSEIRGPAIIGLLPGGGTLDKCRFDGDKDSIFIEVPEGRWIIGAIGLNSCVFRRCRFTQIGIIGASGAVQEMKRKFNIAPSK